MKKVDWCVDDETHEERRQRRQQEAHKEEAHKEEADRAHRTLKVSEELYETILKMLYKYEKNDLIFIDGNSQNIERENIGVKLSSLKK
jgi:uncharacterized protein (UPF0218 family)